MPLIATSKICYKSWKAEQSRPIAGFVFDVSFPLFTLKIPKDNGWFLSRKVAEHIDCPKTFRQRPAINKTSDLRRGPRNGKLKSDVRLADVDSHGGKAEI
jgi:hypothetical protein